MRFADFLLALQGPLLNAAVGVVVSFLVEYVPAFCYLQPRRKRLTVGLISLAVPMGACAVGVLSGLQPAAFELSWWPALVAGFAAFSAATMAHARKLEPAP